MSKILILSIVAFFATVLLYNEFNTTNTNVIIDDEKETIEHKKIKSYDEDDNQYHGDGKQSDNSKQYNNNKQSGDNKQSDTKDDIIEPTYHFTVMGDSGVNTYSQAIMSRITQTSEMHIDLGDFDYMEDNSNPELAAREWYNKLYGSFNGKIYAVLGNHDVSRADLFGELFGISEWNYYIENGDLGMLFLDSNDLPSITDIENNIININNKGKIPLVFMHKPVVTASDQPEMFSESSEELKDIFERNKVRIVFAGHHHIYERYNSTYLVNGMGGEESHKIPDPSLWDGVQAMKTGNDHGYIDIVYDESTKIFHGKYIRYDGKVLDNFTF